MDALATRGARLERRVAGSVLSRLARIAALSAIVLLTVMGLVVCARRASGALVEPLSPAVLATLGVVLAALVLAFRQAVAASYAWPWSLILFVAPTAALAVWIAAVSLPGSGTLGILALIAPLLLEEGFSWGRWRLRDDGASNERPPKVERPTALVEAPSSIGETRDTATADVVADEAVTQSLVRRGGEAGEVIEGFVRVPFAVSQRRAAAHMAICPPFSRVPECFAEQADGPSAQVQVAQVLAHGVRFEIKLDEPASEPATVVVEFSIQEAGDC